MKKLMFSIILLMILMFSAYSVSDKSYDATTVFSFSSLEDNVSDNMSSKVLNLSFINISHFSKYNMQQLLEFNSSTKQKSKNVSSQDTKNATSSNLPSQNIGMDPVPGMQLEMVDKEELRTFFQSSTPKSTDVSHVQEYVTPYADAVQDYLEDENLDGAEEIYEAAVSWIWVSDTILNGQPDAWLTPAEFLEDTPHFDSNPLPGKVVSDCSEQANTLASLLIGSGEYNENTVRVAIGERKFSGIDSGHAWVEVYEDGKWFPVDAVVGPRYDANTSEIVYPDNYEDIDFYYYQEEDYYIVDVWCYYNNRYFISTGSIIGELPDNWYPIPYSY